MSRVATPCSLTPARRTQEYAGLYPWESKEDLVAFRDSELRATIAKAYQTEGDPWGEVFNVVKPCRE